MNYRALILMFLSIWGMVPGSSDVTYAAIINNGGFESGLANWTVVNQVGGDGTFSVQTGTTSPIFGDIVPAPPEGTRAAMSDAGGPGSHVLYQEFVVPTTTPGQNGFTFRASIFVGNRADRFATPASLQFDLPNAGAAGFNQRARIDITLAGATNPFTMTAGDIVTTIYETNVGDPLVSGYNSLTFDLSNALLPRIGQTLRLRIAEVDNLSPFQFGIDQIDISPVPEPSSLLALSIPALGLAWVQMCRRRKKRSS